jgi:excisionase family DNA binding protein
MTAPLTTSEIAELLAPSPRTVRLWVRAGLLPCISIGRQWRFLREAVEGWIAKSKG